MSESTQFMQAVERIDGKLDNIRDSINLLSNVTTETKVRQSMQERQIDTLKAEVEQLKTAYNRASGAWKLLTLPGVLSFVYAVFEILRH